MITTQVLDTARGRPAVGIPVLLERAAGGAWELVGQGETDGDGRLRTLMAADAPVAPGVYRLIFETRGYFDTLGARAFYPRVTIVFETMPGEVHYYVPLLLSPYGYSTYRGS